MLADRGGVGEVTHCVTDLGTHEEDVEKHLKSLAITREDVKTSHDLSFAEERERRQQNANTHRTASKETRLATLPSENSWRAPDAAVAVNPHHRRPSRRRVAAVATVGS